MEDSGYDSDYGFAEFTYVPTLQVIAAVSYEDYCRKTAHSKSEGKPKGKGKGKMKDKLRINCHASDLSPLKTPDEFMDVISGVSDLEEQTVYSLESGTRLKPPVPQLSELDVHAQWVILCLTLALKRGPVFRGIRTYMPTESEIRDIVSGRREGVEDTPSALGVKRLSPEGTVVTVHIPSEPSPPEPAMCTTVEVFPQKRRRVEQSVSTDPDQLMDEKNLERVTGRLEGDMKRILALFSDERTMNLRNDAGKKLIYEIMTLLFHPCYTDIRIDFTTGQDPEQAGGFKGEIQFKPSCQRKLTPSPTKKPIFYSFAGVPDLVGYKLVKKGVHKILFVIEIKSLGDKMGNGVGQLLISAVVAAVKQQSCVLAIHMHPQAISVYRVYPKEGSPGVVCIETLYRRVGLSSNPHNITSEELIDCLKIISKYCK